MVSIDLNADLGEGFGVWRMADDDGLLEVVTSANVACGFHAGDPTIMRRVCARAAERGVAVGAHVSYRDLAGFGRRPMDVPCETLRSDVTYQIGGLAAMAAAAGTEVRYVKAHGALYNRAADDRPVAEAVAEAVADVDAGLTVLCLPGSVQETVAAERGLRVVAEGYLDRAYDDRGRLVPRGTPDAVLHDAGTVVARAVELATAGSVRSIDGHEVVLDVRSLCTHGDTPAALELARAARSALEEAGVSVRSFAPPPGAGSVP